MSDILPPEEVTRHLALIGWSEDDHIEPLQAHDAALRARLVEAVELLREIADGHSDYDFAVDPEIVARARVFIEEQDRG